MTLSCSFENCSLSLPRSKMIVPMISLFILALYLRQDVYSSFVVLILFHQRERERDVLFKDALNTFYMASDISLRTILIVRKETRCRHIGYSYRLTARVLLYAPSHRQDNTYHGLCYTSRGALAGTRNSSMAPPHEGSIRRP